MVDIKVHCAFTEMMPIEKVIPNPRNPNQHPDKQIALLAKIIEAQGWRAPITVSKRSGYVVRGHGRLMAALKLGCATVPVDLQDYENEAAEWADLIADNRLAELANIDTEMMAELLAEVGNMAEFTGFTQDEIEQMITEAESHEIHEDDYDAVAAAEEAKKNTISKPGDIWTLGNHRLMCGDSTSVDAVKCLLGGWNWLIWYSPIHRITWRMKVGHLIN